MVGVVAARLCKTSFGRSADKLATIFLTEKHLLWVAIECSDLKTHLFFSFEFYLLYLNYLDLWISYNISSFYVLCILQKKFVHYSVDVKEIILDFEIP